MSTTAATTPAAMTAPQERVTNRQPTARADLRL